MSPRKTNKALRKRLKITRRGKALVRTAGHGHFNAKKGREKKLRIKRLRPLAVRKKELTRLGGDA